MRNNYTQLKLFDLDNGKRCHCCNTPGHGTWISVFHESNKTKRENICWNCAWGKETIFHKKYSMTYKPK